MNTRIIIHPENKEQLRALKVMKALKIPFEVERSTYDPNFVSKIKQGEKDIKEGRTRVVNIDELWTVSL